MIVAIGCGFLDLLTDRWHAMQRQLFPIVLCVLYFLCIITMYYGPDIRSYVPHYENIGTPSEIWHNEYNQFELGYSLVCSIFNGLGLNYWWLTWFAKTLYFIALWLLLRLLPKRQIFALATIVMTDINLIMHETRQCLAVAFFIFMVLLMQNRRYLWAVVCAVLSVSMHKSGFFPVALTACGIFFYHTRQYSAIYTFLTIGLLLLIAVPVQRISASIVNILPLPHAYLTSLSHHLSIGLQFQTIAVIYLAILLVFSLVLSYDSKRRYTWIAFVTLCGMGLIVLLYPYYYLLVRLRSYFVPFIVFYLITVFSDGQRTIPYQSLIKQSLMVLVLFFYIHVAVSQERGAHLLHSPVYRASTVFELKNATAQQIRNRQMKIATVYWEKDYMQRAKSSL